MTQHGGELLGVLWRCMERRYGFSQRAAFENATDLGSTKYWDLALAGGATKRWPNDLIIAIDHGATIVGMGAHGDGCGGNPGLEDDQIMSLLQEQISNFRNEFSGLTVFALFSTDQGGTQIWQV